MAKEIKITKSSKTETLTREQKKFNTHLQKIKKAKRDIELLKEDNRWLMVQGDAVLQPAMQKNKEAYHELVLALHNSPFKSKLTANQKNKLDEIIRYQLEHLVHETEDPELIEIYNFYNDTSFEEEKEQNEAERKEMMQNMMKQMFGVEVDLTNVDLDNVEELENLKEEVREKVEKNQEAQAEREAKRKKTPKQLEKEAKEKEMEAQLAKTSKKLYLELVKNFHPDQEQDEQEKARKTEIMQEITVAYKNDDFLKLLELQVSLLEGKEDKMNSMNDATLVYYNKILKEQVEELERQVKMLKPRFNGHPYGHFYFSKNRAKTEESLKDERDTIEEETESVNHDISLVNNLQGLKKFLKEFKAIHQIDISGLFSLLNR